MASPTPLMPFLRPLGLPRPSTLRHFTCFTTSPTCRAAHTKQLKQERKNSPSMHSHQPAHKSTISPNASVDANLVASRTASPSYPPPSMKSMPRPKESRASRRTSHPPKERHYPTRQPTHTPPTPVKLIPEPVEPLPPAQCAPNLPYFITRTPSNELPVYTLRKRGGNMKLTRVKKIDGDAEALRDQLRETLGLEEKMCVVNGLTRHVMLKGHHKPAVDRFLRERMF